MPVTIVDRGHGNSVEIDSAVEEQSTGTITLQGSGNHIRIEAGCLLSNASISLADECSFTAGRDCRLAAIEVVARRGGMVMIGAGSKFTWHTRLYLHERSALTIGRFCLIASDTLFMTSDMHSILDRATGTRINPAQDITLGDRVWLAAQAVVLKGAFVGTGSVVGFGSVVSSVIPAHVLCAGRPARLIRENIRWDEALL